MSVFPDSPEPCPDCGAAPGRPHREGCDVARCSECGRQHIGCEHGAAAAPWTGLWPGLVECREFGWYAKLGPHGWLPCDRADPQGMEDLNRLYRGECRWDKDRARWMRLQS